jgi:Glyoxalase/Bleomycin resistance protein/Dioxygenase superfamily
MSVARVESVVYGVDDLAAGIRYFDDWGLVVTERGQSGADYTLPSGQTIRLRLASDGTLPPATEPGATAREVIWGVEDPEALDAIGAELARDRAVERDAAGVLHSRDPNGIALGFCVMSSTATPASPTAATPRARPLRIAHVEYGITHATAEDSARFYLDRLEFRLTDLVEGGRFLRNKGSSDHHNLFLRHTCDSVSFKHVAFTVSDFAEVTRGGNEMLARGWTKAGELGEHDLSGHRFWYFLCPCGGQTEYFIGTMRIPENWQPRIRLGRGSAPASMTATP